jgi:hypothetical protein
MTTRPQWDGPIQVLSCPDAVAQLLGSKDER